MDIDEERERVKKRGQESHTHRRHPHTHTHTHTHTYTLRQYLMLRGLNLEKSHSGQLENNRLPNKKLSALKERISDISI